MAIIESDWMDAGICVTNEDAKRAHHAAQVDLDRSSTRDERAARWDAIQLAKEACSHCPVFLQCRVYGENVNASGDPRDNAGVFGGVSYDILSDTRPGKFKGSERDCQQCGAEAGEYCVSADGVEQTRVHAIRLYEGHVCEGDGCKVVLMRKQRKRCDPCRAKLNVQRITAYRARKDAEHEAAQMA